MQHINGDLNHYEVLGILSTNNPTRISTEDIKRAYRQALLRHHPDKTQSPNITETRPSGTSSSIDRIILAYQTLSKPSARAEYDRLLHLQQRTSISSSHSQRTQTWSSPPENYETMDLDDMVLDEERQVWYANCRCGAERGYIVSEAELEKHIHEGSILVMCHGCSLWLKVEFEVEQEESEEQEMRLQKDERERLAVGVR